MEPTIALFPGSFDALYEGTDLLAISLEEELTDMAAFKAKYTAAFVADFKLKIETARNLEDEEQRAARHEKLRIQLVKATDNTIRAKLGDLRLYIRDAYPDKETREVNLQEAGFNDAEKGLRYNWEVLRSVMQKANTFISANTADLSANNNMPVGFPADFATLKTTLDTKVLEFLNTRENTKQGTEDKLKASNELYQLAISICEDGQHVFAKRHAKQQQFVWDAIMELVTPKGKAGLKFDVKEEETNVPLAGVTATIQKEGSEAVVIITDANGKGYFENLPEGEYKGNLQKSGYQKLDVVFIISTGVTSFKHWYLLPDVVTP